MCEAIAYATSGPGVPFARQTITRRTLGPRDVLIDIRYAGICRSDIDAGRSEWESAHYPLVPGHEIAGVVGGIGDQVIRYAVGDRVGVGCMVGSCGRCPACRAGEEQFCPDMITTYGALDRDGTWTAGGYSTQIVVDEDFVLRIPDGIELDVAAPLLCAGITMYAPLKRWGAGHGRNVAIVGLGGLGHLGVKVAAALGADVTVFDRSAAKTAGAFELGAGRFIVVDDEHEVLRDANHFDLIVITAPTGNDVTAYLRMLRLDGTLVSLGLSNRPQRIFPADLIRQRRRWVGSMMGGIRETQEMLDFCAANGLGAEIETITGRQIDQAWDRVVAGDVRYRFVIDTATFV